MNGPIESLKERAITIIKSLGWDMDGNYCIAIPARLCLGVEHGDYNGLRQVGITVNRYLLIVFRPTRRKKIRLYSEAFADDGVIEIESSNPQTLSRTGWDRFPAMVLEVLAERRNTTGQAFDAVIVSDIPGGGMSRSAALCLGLLDVINCTNELGIESDSTEMPKLAQAVEHRLGSPCGLLDQIMIWYGMDGHAVLYNPMTDHIGYAPIHQRLIDEWCFMALYTGLDRQGLGADTRSRYPERVFECQELLRLVQDVKGRLVASLAQVVVSDSLYRWTVERYRGDYPELVSRLDYLFEANNRYDATVKALGEGDPETIGRNISSDGIGLNRDYDISGPELELMVQIARANGADARMSGGGDIGTAMAWLRQGESVGRLITAIYREYPRVFPLLKNAFTTTQLAIAGGIVRFPLA